MPVVNATGSNGTSREDAFCESSSVKAQPFGAQQDLVDAIDRGEYPSWTVKVQIMSEEDARTCAINPFDLTKVWPHADFPLIEVGQLELNRNVDNYFVLRPDP